MKLKLNDVNGSVPHVVDFALIALAVAPRTGPAGIRLFNGLTQILDEIEFDPAIAEKIIATYRRRHPQP
ncbi:MAG TPA: hypothetical protein VLH79_06880 [Chthonomonadales bacterium]|nr:hypothetical protein [Chthonomonadales bacterium]